MRLAKLYWRIACARSDALHKLSDYLTKNYAWIAIEDLNVRGMMSNPHLARSIADAEFGELRRQLTYKAEQRGVHLAVVDRWYPSSKTCSACGAANAALTLSDRHWICSECGAEHDRDVNAARNILAEGKRAYEEKTKTAGVAEIVCGAEGSGLGRKTRSETSRSEAESLNISCPIGVATYG
jgi:putative transposase